MSITVSIFVMQTTCIGSIYSLIIRIKSFNAKFYSRYNKSIVKF